jgi:uncharacterized membrane protein
MISIPSKLPITLQSINLPKRSVAKTLIWRMVAELDTFIVSYSITGSMSWSLSIVGFESASKTVLYYVHERAWGHILWGRAP